MGSKTLNIPGKDLLIAHVNMCILRNKKHELSCMIQLKNVHILAIAETHLDPSFENTELGVDGYTLFRKDWNIYGGGVAFYVQNKTCLLNL